MGSSGYFIAIGQENPLLHTWSLAVEEQYYLIFPVLLLMLWRLGRHRVVGALALGAALSFGLAEVYALRGDGDGFYLLPTRAWELLIGALAALTPHDPLAPANRWRQGLSLAGLAAILVSVFTIDPAAAFPSAFALLPTLGAAAILALGDARNLGQSPAQLSPVRWPRPDQLQRLSLAPAAVGLRPHALYPRRSRRDRRGADPADAAARLPDLALCRDAVSRPRPRFDAAGRPHSGVGERRAARRRIGVPADRAHRSRRRSCRSATRRWRRSSADFSPTTACRPPAISASTTSRSRNAKPAQRRR